MLALLDRLGIERAAYCGLSIGGMVGQWLAINAPHRITKLILICTAAHLPPPSAWTERAASVRDAGTPEVVADAVVGRWFTAPFAAANPTLVADYREMIATTAAEGYASCCEAISTLDLRAGLPAVTAPTLVIGGAQDPSIPPEHGRAIAAAIRAARFELLDPAAHLASVERARRGHPPDRRPPGGRHLSDPEFEAGMSVRREVLGDAHVDRAIERTTELTAPFQEFITRFVWGGVWTRPGLDRQARSMITLAVLTALGRENEIELHVRAALPQRPLGGADRRGAAPHRRLRGRARRERCTRDRAACARAKSRGLAARVRFRSWPEFLTRTAEGPSVGCSQPTLGPWRLAGQRLPEATYSFPERRAHLGQALGAEHEQDDDQDDRDVKWVLESDHRVSVGSRCGP